MQFSELDLHPSTHSALEAMGFTEATAIQAETLPALLAGRDLIGQARTGTGKTAAFGIPLIEGGYQGHRGLVLTPTRELAKQVQRELQAIGKGSPVDVVCLIGGAPFGDQVRAMERHPDAILVATPGRVVDHLGRGTLTLDGIHTFVLDEADEMLSMGFADELDAIVQTLPKERQSVLFTATLAPAIERLAKKTLRDPVTVRMGAGAAPDVHQCFATVAGRDRPDAIARILEAEDPRAALLFARTRARVEDLARRLGPVGGEALHGGMGQPMRDAVMRRFREGRTRLLVATDVAARGLDVEEVDLILHDEPAGDTDTYIHRIGRTARAGRSGRSILFLSPGKIKRLGALSKVVGRLEEYKVPDQDALGRIRNKRLVEKLGATEPSDQAHALLKKALQSGMDVQDVALYAIEHLLSEGAEPPAAEEGPKTQAALALKVGKIDNVHPGSIVGVLTNAGGLRAEDIGRIDVLDKMSVVEVPADQLERLCQDLGGVRLSGRLLLPREAEDWRFKTPPRR